MTTESNITNQVINDCPIIYLITVITIKFGTHFIPPTKIKIKHQTTYFSATKWRITVKNILSSFLILYFH